MTPDQARALLDGTTPGPWEVETVPEMRYYDGETWETPGKIVVYADEATLFVAADEFVGDEGDEHDNEKNVRLAVAAPALASMVAGMRPEYAVQVLRSGGWQYSREEDDFRWQGLAVQMVRADRDHPGEETRLVRRYVTEPEAEADREPPTDDFHSSIGLWQLPPSTWEEA